ncbi:DUF881 domain-containing protein [Microlunatus soli]|uniref:Uncharacterized conserved protein YlxW, UPF0749 family n=1 Tax=Microlunatus soli TaxID=630515 RepID=A0A1H1TQK4_9ACTN|nr:DUF881 domain-containing protein [Microlunatus soli]SDS61849.1 Uncharacterized conserved protein YlxW, UPF0749 family [Microlunatus soli]
MHGQSIGERVRRALVRARVRQRLRNRRKLSGKVLTGVVCLLAGLMITVSAINARGIDLRPARNTDLISLVESESQRNAELAEQATDLRTEVDRLASRERQPSLDAELAARSRQAGLAPVAGPSLTVTLDDAPSDVAADGVDEDLLVVHQQDIQSIVNLLWAGGAEAMTIQGQRVISTTGIKCVGNTVVLHGVPYAPPYRISAIGDQERLRQTLEQSEFVRIYQQYVDRFRLGYRVDTKTEARFPAYRGALNLQYAHARG